MTQTLQELTNYIASTWLENPLWPSLPWSVFGRVICTNDDVEGWHCCLNQKKKANAILPACTPSTLENEITCLEEKHYRIVQSRVLSILG